jgi:hypothetical protein
MPFIDDKSDLLTALSRVPSAANQQAVSEFVERLDKVLSDVLSFGSSGNTLYVYLVGQEAAAVARFSIVFGPPITPGVPVSFGIDLKSPSTHAWVNKVTYTQT